MAYYLTVNDKMGYKLLDVTQLEEFKRISKFKNNAYCLEEIDIFTSKFINELALKEKLYRKGIITLDDITKKIEARIKIDGKLKAVTHGLVYQDTAKYLEITYLKSCLLILQDDKVFLNKLLDKYLNSSYKKNALRDINALLNGYQGDDINMFSALNDFLIDEIFAEDKKTGEVKLKYKSLHDLAMFIYNYLSKKDKSIIEQNQAKLERVEKLNTLKKEVQKPLEQAPVKKKVRKLRQELEGQTSFF